MTDPYPLVAATDPVLRRRAVEATSAWGLAHVADRMLATVRAGDGVGLAAPQVGISVRLFVTPILDGHAAVNPAITPIGVETETALEGCLSLPGHLVPVERHATVLLSARRVDWTPFTVTLTGFDARVVQHEVDHLDGKVIW